jgi:hypothetical protein
VASTPRAPLSRGVEAIRRHITGVPIASAGIPSGPYPHASV